MYYGKVNVLSFLHSRQMYLSQCCSVGGRTFKGQKPKLPRPLGEIDSRLSWCFPYLSRVHAHAERRLDGWSRFWMAHSRDRQTDRHIRRVDHDCNNRPLRLKLHRCDLLCICRIQQVVQETHNKSNRWGLNTVTPTVSKESRRIRAVSSSCVMLVSY